MKHTPLILVLAVFGCTKTVTNPPIIKTDSIIVVDTLDPANVPVVGSVKYDSVYGYELSATTLHLVPGATARWQMNLSQYPDGSLPYIQEGTAIDCGVYNGITVQTFGQYNGVVPVFLTSSPRSIEFEFVVIDSKNNIIGSYTGYAN
jgi:hypothetical protein